VHTPVIPRAEEGAYLQGCSNPGGPKSTRLPSSFRLGKRSRVPRMPRLLMRVHSVITRRLVALVASHRRSSTTGGARRALLTLQRRLGSRG
jgi:hypothetical protein